MIKNGKEITLSNEASLIGWKFQSYPSKTIKTIKTMKKNTILLLLPLLLISGCEDSGKTPPVHAANKGESYDVHLFFEVDGVKVYRFRDGSHDIYFINTNGLVQSNRTVRTGKVTRTVQDVTYCNRKP